MSSIAARSGTADDNGGICPLFAPRAAIRLISTLRDGWPGAKILASAMPNV